MTHSFMKTEKATIILNDLIKINNERVICYQLAIERAVNLDSDLTRLFKIVIAESLDFKQQLVNKINEHEGGPKTGVGLSGLIYRAWHDLKVILTGNTRNSIVNFCKYNEEVALHAYRAALNLSNAMTSDISELIERQQELLLRSFQSIKQLQEARPYSAHSLAYFN